MADTDIFSQDPVGVQIVYILRFVMIKSMTNILTLRHVKRLIKSSGNLFLSINYSEYSYLFSNCKRI
jgi:hypothetical protein